MAIKPVTQLKNQAQLIKNETTPSANTATRIGQELLDVVDTFAAEISGHPPYIGEDGFWHQWDMELSQYVNTEVAAKGDTGPTGLQGRQGLEGNTGQKGDTGSSGVLVSETAPSDPQVNVWLKPSGEVPEFATKEDLSGKADLAPATVAGNLAGLDVHGNLQDSGIEPGSIARLDVNGELLPRQLSALQGLQTGFNATDGMYRSTAPALLFRGSRTVEVLIKLGPNPTGHETVFDMRGDAGSIRMGIVPNNMFACLSGGMLPYIQGRPGEYYHIVIRLDSGNNTSTLFMNGVQVQTIDSNIGNPVYFSLGGYGSTGIMRFGGIINSLRTFNYALSDAECLSLWNGGRPNEYMVTGVGSMRDGLIGEFLPCGLLPDKWRDTSGNGLDLAAVGAPLLCYETVPDMREIIVDTGVFYTNIAEGVSSKRITIPSGYAVSRIYLRNNNPNGLQAFRGSLDFGGGALWGPIDIAHHNHARGNWFAINPAACWYPKYGQAGSIAITAQGNTTDGGMQVKLICQYIGQ